MMCRNCRHSRVIYCGDGYTIVVPCGESKCKLAEEVRDGK